ncbi:hypothetical protein D3C87_354740 [compost metagenome]
MANQFLIKNRLDDIRTLSAAELTALTNGTYDGLLLLGYHQANDTPHPINYYLSNTAEQDNAGSVIAVGGKKLEHKFTQQIDSRYFGTKGDGIADDADALIRCIKSALYHKVPVYIPKTAAHYNVTKNIRVPFEVGSRVRLVILSNGALIKPNQKLTHSKGQNIWNVTQNREVNVFSLGADGIYPYPPNLYNIFDNNVGHSVEIDGLEFDLSVYDAVPSATPYNNDIVSAFQISAERIRLSNIRIDNGIGSAIRLMGVRRLNLSNITVNNFGGRDKNLPMTLPDSYGDALHIMGTKPGARYVLEGCHFVGKQTAGNFSRCGIVHEFMINYNNRESSMIVRDSTIANFSKCFHTEQTGYFQNTFENVKFFNFNMLAANAASISDITYLNCDVEQKNVDGLEQLEASILSYIESSGNAVTKFIGGRISQMTTIPNRNAQIGSIVLFQGVDFYSNGNNLRFYDGKNVVFDSCVFNGFGSEDANQYSVSGWVANEADYSFSNCSFLNNSNRYFKSDNQYLRFHDCKSESKVDSYTCGKDRPKKYFVSNIFPKADDIFQIYIPFVGSANIDLSNYIPRSFLESLGFFAVLVGTNKDNGRGFDNFKEIVRNEQGYYLINPYWHSSGWWQYDRQLKGTIPAGFEVSTSNGGLIWLNAQRGTNVNGVYLIVFSRKYWEYFGDKWIKNIP